MKKIGRPVKLPKRVFDPVMGGLQLFADELKKVFQENKAPKQWIGYSDFIYGCLCLPVRLRQKENAELWALLMYENPEFFCHCILEFRKRCEKRRESPRFQTAMCLISDPALNNLDELTIAEILNKQKRVKGGGVTVKTVQAARRFIRQ